jgi:carbamoyltransferase
MWTDFRGLRFDSISAGVQLLHEKMVVSLIRNWIKKTGISKLAVAGGCFMNVKANKLVAEMDECEDIFVMPSCGDDSCAIGAAIWSYAKAAPENSEQIRPVEHLYWGPDYTDSEIKQVLNEFSPRIKFKRCENIEKETAGLLAEHKIIGRLSGKMEWGSRALGNRSILANPSRMRNIGRLNAAIKMRDFWMPFAPSILWEKRNDYAKIPKDVNSYYMTLAYDSSSLAREHFIAALHPYDFTMRPQFVKKEHNAKYHRLISEFESISGIGGVLNTSFNLHGSPIICNPRDALETFINSALDYVTIEDYLIAKRDQSF